MDQGALVHTGCTETTNEYCICRSISRCCDYSVSAFGRIRSNLTSGKLHYGKTYSNFISGATMNVLLNILSCMQPCHARTMEL